MKSNPKLPLSILGDKRIRPGWHLYIEGFGEFEILEPDPKSNTKLFIPVKHTANQEIRTFSISDFDRFAAENLPYFFAPTADELQQIKDAPEHKDNSAPSSPVALHLIRRAEIILSNIKTIDDLLLSEEKKYVLAGETFRRDKCLRRICDELRSTSRRYYGFCRSSYYYYSKLIKAANWDVTKLALGLRRNTFGVTKMSPAQTHFVDTVILKHGASRGFVNGLPSIYDLLQGYIEHTRGWWIDPDKCTDVHLDLIDELMNANLPIDIILSNPEKAELLTRIKLISRAWFYRHYHWFIGNPQRSEKEMIQKYGREFYEANLMVFDIFVHRASLPLEYVFADHCYLDIIVVDDDSRKNTFRIWVTILIDAFTRAILGMAINSRAPSINSIQSALKNAVWDKKDFLGSLGLEYPEGKGWETYGISLSLSLDNAWAHHSLSLEGLGRKISCGGRYNSIELNFRPPYRGRYGALIERYLGNIQLKVKTSLKLGAIHTAKPGGVRNAAKDAVYLMKDVEQAIVELIVIYMHTPHRELNGLTPHQKWLEGMQSGWPQVPPRTPANERLFWIHSPKTRIITKRGISAFGLTYWSPELKIAQRVGPDGKAIRYAFSYDDGDISRIALFRGDKYICDIYAKELRRPDGTYAHTSIAERKLAKKIAVQSGKSSLAWLQFLQEKDALGKHRQSEKHAAIRRAQRSHKPTPTISLTTRDGSSQLDRLRQFSSKKE
jgi:hypothetical protein